MSEWIFGNVEMIADSMAMGPFGSDIKSSNFVTSGVPVIRGGNLSNGKFSDENFVFISSEKADELKKSNAFPGDIIFTHRGTLGQVGIIPKNSKYARYVVSQSQMKLTCDVSKVDPKFVYYYFLSPVGQNELLSNTSITGVPAISHPLTSLKKMKIPLPPLETQKKIAAVLSSLDDKIELNTRMNKVLEEIAQVIFKRWFVEFEFPNEKGEPYRSSGGKMKESELGLIPEGWGVKTLGDICESVSKTHSFNKESLIFLNTGDIDNGRFNHANYSLTNEMPGQAKKSIKQQDILYSEIRPINRHFAFVNFDAQDYVVSTKLMVIRSKHINPRRLYQFLTSKEIINSLQKEAEARSGTFPQIRFENIKVLKMLIGNDSIESTYSHILNTIYNLIDRNTRENKVIEEIRDTLLPKLMSMELLI